MGDKRKQYWFERVPPHRRPQAPRMFKILAMIRRFAGPQARRELGLSDFEWRVMSQVGDHGPMSLNELAAASRNDTGQLSRGVKRLVEAGLLVRESRRGERGVFISPTEAGRKVFDQLIDLAYRQNDMVFEGVPPEQLEVFNAVLDRIEVNVQALMEAELDCRAALGETEDAPAPPPAPARPRKVASAR